MRTLNRETLIAIFLLIFCSLLAWSSLQIRNPGFGTLAPATWPQIVIVVLTLFSIIYFFQSLRYQPDEEEIPKEGNSGIFGFLEYYRSPALCFLAYGVFLGTLKWMGALIGGILLVFFLLSILGGWSLRDIVKHAIYSIISMGLMWSLFTFGLRVILPEGEIFSVR